MTGLKWLYISKNYKVVNVPQPKEFKFKAIKELSQQEVLRVMLFYRTTDRKPSQLEYIEFDRIILDTHGSYDNRNSIRTAHLYDNFMASAQSIADRKKPITLPLAPDIPTLKEKDCLYDYLDKKFPLLKEAAPVVVEIAIRKSKRIHQEQINLIKEASKLRNRA